MVTSSGRVLLLVTLSLAAWPLATVQAVDLSGGIVNLAPVIISVTLSSSSLTPTAGTTTPVTSTIVVSDGNGFNDITGVTVEVLKPDGSTTHITAAAASAGAGSGLQVTYTKTSNMNFYDAAALTTSTYKVKVIATDTQSATGSNIASLATFNYAQLAAMNPGASSVSLGSNLNPGDTGSAASLSIQNYGNIQIDVQVSGTALSHGTLSASIPVGSVAYSLASNMGSSAGLTGSAVTVSSFDLGAGSSSSKTVYWQVTAPSASSQYVPAGTYTGTLTLTALSG